MRKVTILPAAEDDLDAAQEFYESQSPGLGEYFLDSISVDVESLANSAGVHRMIHGLRRLICERFPYAIYYREQGDLVCVYAVIDCRRDPASIRQRLRGR